MEETEGVDDATHAPRVRYEKVAEYLSVHPFDLYIVNEYTAPFVSEKSLTLSVPTSNKVALEAFLALHSMHDARIVGIGAGAVIDATKYVASCTASHFTCIPSALSTNSFATHRNSFFDSNVGKVSINSGVAETIVIDYDLLAEAAPLNLFGLVEIASVATAQVDCRITTRCTGETFRSDWTDRASRLVETFLSLCVASFSVESYPKLLEGLLESGALTRVYGSGRLVSGAEHIISSHIERDLACPHGMGLLFGILIAEQLQSRSGFRDEATTAVVERLRTNDAMRRYITKVSSPSAIIAAAGGAHARPDKYTVFNLPDVSLRYPAVLNETVHAYFAQS